MGVGGLGEGSKNMSCNDRLWTSTVPLGFPKDLLLIDICNLFNQLPDMIEFTIKVKMWGKALCDKPHADVC